MGRVLTRVIVALIIAICFSIIGFGGTGSLIIKSQPDGADVYIDSNYRGSTPLDITDLPSGNHIIKITKNGYYEWENATEVSDSSMEISAYLKEMKSKVDINIEAGIGEVYIDNNYEGFVNKEIPLSVYLTYDSHIINISRNGCNYWNKTLQINEPIMKIDSSFRCIESPERKGAEIKFAFEGPSSLQNAGNTLNLEVIVKNTGSVSKNKFLVVLSVRDPTGNWTVLPYQSFIIEPYDNIHAYFIHDIPATGPSGSWILRASVWDRIEDGGNYKQSQFSNLILIKWNTILEGGNLRTRYDSIDKILNVSGPNQNISAGTAPLSQPEVIATPTGNIVYTKVITSKFGQPDLKINGGDEVIWYNEDSSEYKIIEIDNRIGEMTILSQGKAKFVFNKSGNYRFRLYKKYSYTKEIFATPSIQNINVVPPITPTITSTTSPSVTSTSKVTETPASMPAFTPESTQIPEPEASGFEAIIAGIGIFCALALRRK